MVAYTEDMAPVIVDNFKCHPVSVPLHFTCN